MQIIQYKNNEKTVACGFKENDYVVFAETGVKEGWSKPDYLQYMYEENKHAIDYEAKLYQLNKPNSIITDEVGEEWTPEPPKPSRIEISIGEEYIEFDEETQKDVAVSTIVYDQYGEEFDGTLIVSSDVGTYYDGVLTVDKPLENIICVITAETEGLVVTKELPINLKPPFDIDGKKVELIEESKIELERFLSDNPYQYLDGKYYSVTKDKQNLLNNAIAVYQMKVQAGLPAEITWNATGETCTIWSIEDIIGLALAIAGYVEPLVSHQQELEVEINNCTTKEELETIVIDYATV